MLNLISGPENAPRVSFLSLNGILPSEATEQTAQDCPNINFVSSGRETTKKTRENAS